MANDIGPANPAVEKVWKKRSGVEFGAAAAILTMNEDLTGLLDDPDSMPVSVGFLALVYGVSNKVAREAVIHWLRRDAATEVQD